VRVAVLSGGRSSEHEVSLSSGAAVIKGLEEAGHEVVEVRIGRDGRWSAAGEAVALAPGGGLLGSDVLASATCLDKLTLKRILAGQGIPQVDFVEVGEAGWRERCAELRTPLWVKPSRMGSSVGISRIEDLAALDSAIETALRHDPRVIVEASAQGREIECSVLGNEEPRTSMPGEILAHAQWYDYEAKYAEGGMDLAVPAPISEIETARVRELAAEVFRLAGCSGLARCDFFVEPDGTVLVNEINTMPGFTETSVYAKLLEADGLPYPALCDRLVALALERHDRARTFEF
jgi:D-alanine-D-alanine ligase